MSTSAAATYALLTDGSTVEVRLARPQDSEAVRAMHAAMSPDNIYLRFFSMSPGVAEQEARRVCREPDSDHAALLAWQGDRLVGVAAYEPAGKPGVAEVAFAVSDDMHGRGIASLLLEHLVWQARQRGLRAFTAETLAENSAMLRVFADAGLPAKRRISDGVVELTFPLPVGQDERLLGSYYLESVASRESRADVASLRPLLQPRSVAVVGASRRGGTVGRAILHNIVTSGFTGPVYAVSTHARTMEGVPCVASVDDLPGPVDLAVIAVPPSAVPEVAVQCGRHGVRGLIVISSSRGAAGAELLAVCRRYGIRLVGPNCFGVIMPWIGLDATFAADHPVRGVVGLVVQSGGVGIALLEQMSRLGIGVSSFVSAGDKYDVSPTDLLTWWAQDEVTQIAVLYVESFGNPRKFASTARRVAQRMPVLTVVGARSPAGHRAASHTTAAPTPLVSQEAMFDQAGVITARSLGELVDTAALLACQPLPAGNRVAIVANAGGAAALAADACADHGLQVVELAAATQRALRRLLPPAAVVTGPVDTCAAVTTETFRACLEEVAADDGVDAVLAVAVPTAFSDLSAAVAEAVISKPLAVALLDRAESVTRLKRRPVALPPSGPHSDAGAAGDPPAAGPAAAGQAAAVVDVAAAAVTGVPCYADPDNAARALGHAVRYRAWRGRHRGKVPELDGLRAADARALVAGFLVGSPAGGWLPGASAADLVSCYGVPLVATVAAATEEEAAAAAGQLGGRVVLKAEAEGLVHRTDAGGVKVDLRTPQEVAGGYRALAAEFGPRLRRVLVQPMLAGGVEVHIGVVQEPVFGPLVVFGSGGAATGVPGDQVARLTPLTDADAGEMIHAVRAAPLLASDRGTPPADTAGLAGVLLRVSRLTDDLPEVSQLDLNPVVVRQDGVSVCGRAGADQPGRAQGSLPAPAAVSTLGRVDAYREQAPRHSQRIR